MILSAAPAVLMGAFLACEPAYQGTNCDGNSSALGDVHRYLLVVRMAAEEDTDRPFDPAAATAEQREYLNQIVDDIGIRTGRFLVSSRPHRVSQSGPRKVLIVCDTPFDNVPRRALGLAPPSHAAGFSDGTTGLISVAEFEALDRSALVPLDDLLAAPNP